jgi:hypothetical protein
MLKIVKSDEKHNKSADDVLIHVRYLSSGAVMLIDKCPAHFTAQEWRDLLLREASGYYQTFVGSRGFFRLPRNIYNALVADVTPMAAE